MNVANHTTPPLVSLRKLESLLRHKREILREAAFNGKKHYRPFTKRNRRTGKARQIDNPTGLIKNIQALIKRHIFDHFTLPDSMIGGVRGRKLSDNLKLHIGSNLVTCLDIRNCFPSIKAIMVFDAYKKNFGCSHEIANLLTRLTTYKNRLPQGAPTSTFLAALVMIPLLADLKRILNPLGLSVTFWVDDITISGPEHRKHIGSIISLIGKHKLAVSTKKILVMPRTKCQMVTGGAVNKTPSLGRRRRTEYRVFITKANLKLPADIQRVKSRINFARMINPRQGRSLERQWSKKILEG